MPNLTKSLTTKQANDLICYTKTIPKEEHGING